MKVFVRISEFETIYSGKRIPAAFVIADNSDDDSYVLGMGSTNPEGRDAIVTGLEYVINKKHYSLDGWGLKARITDDGILIPVLRRAKGEERSILQYTVREPHKLPHKEGDKNDWWPVVVSLPSVSEVKSEFFTETVMNEVEAIEATGNEIEEDMSFEDIEDFE